MGKDKLESRTGAENRSQITKGLVRSELKSKAPSWLLGSPVTLQSLYLLYQTTEQRGTCQCSDRWKSSFSPSIWKKMHIFKRRLINTVNIHFWAYLSSNQHLGRIDFSPNNIFVWLQNLKTLIIGKHIKAQKKILKITATHPTDKISAIIKCSFLGTCRRWPSMGFGVE